MLISLICTYLHVDVAMRHNINDSAEQSSNKTIYTAPLRLPFHNARPQNHDHHTRLGGERALSDNYGSSFEEGRRPKADFSAETYADLQADIVTMPTDSKDYWPADFGHYDGLMIRLA